LFPRPVFRRAWEVLDERVEARKACRVYVGLLHLAAMHGCEATAYLTALILWVFASFPCQRESPDHQRSHANFSRSIERAGLTPWGSVSNRTHCGRSTKPSGGVRLLG
jgi:hypothetical protein